MNDVVIQTVFEATVLLSTAAAVAIGAVLAQRALADSLPAEPAEATAAAPRSRGRALGAQQKVVARVDAAVARATRAAVPSPAMDVLVSALRAFTILFFVPSLSLRYWGSHPSAILCGLLMVLLGVVGGAAGGWAARLAFVNAGHGLPELLLARVVLSFLAVTIVAFRTVEIFVCWPVHETKSQADQA